MNYSVVFKLRYTCRMLGYSIRTTCGSAWLQWRQLLRNTFCTWRSLSIQRF